MKSYLILFFLLFNNVIYSQKITFLDSIDHQPISYVEVMIDGNSYFSDSLGILEFTKNIEQPMIIKKIGYINKKQNFNSIVFLSPIVKEIEEVILIPKKDYAFNSKSLNKNTTKVPNDLSIGFILQGKIGMTGILKEISIPVKKIYNNKTLLKIDFYNVSNKIIADEPINVESIFVNINDLIKKENNKINLQKYNITITEKILVGMRIIDETGTTEKLFSEPSIQFYNSKEKGDLYFYNQHVKEWKILTNNINLIGLSYTISY